MRFLAFSLVSSLIVFGSVSASPAPLQPRAAPEIRPCDSKFFTQKIDHYGQSNGTFQQRYSIFPEYFKPGGPIQFYQGEEITHVECGNDTILYEWAQDLDGLVVSLEHRYFGASKPFGNESSKVENLKYMTLENIMDDAVEFLQQIKKNVTGTENSKVIMASGSYGGFLSGAFRLNRPETIYGALASAGPTMGLGNSSNPDSYRWNNWINRIYQDKSIVASQNIQKGFVELMKLITSGDFSTLQSAFGLCDTPKTETAVIMPIIALTMFTFAAEFNYHMAHPASSLVYPLEQVIKIAETEPDPLQVLNRTTWLYVTSNDLPCVDPSIEFVGKVFPYIEQPYFQYINCKFMPMNAPSYIDNGTIFPPMNGADGFPAGCQQQFNITPPTQAEIEEKYHFSRQEFEQSTRIIWSKGEYDPASAVEPVELPLSKDRMASRTLFAPKVGHIEDTYRSDPGDPEGLTWLRSRELEIIKGWLEPVDVFEGQS